MIVFLGYPGSGKTYFSKNLADKIGAVTLNSDALRLSMFKSEENISAIRENQRSRLYDDVFGAMDYVAKQILKSGYSVIYDAQQSKRENRKNIERLAKESGAVPILVWIKTSREVAIKRVQERDDDSDSLRYSAEKAAYLVDRFIKAADLPEMGENLIEINGEVDFLEQYKTFEKKVFGVSDGDENKSR